MTTNLDVKIGDFVVDRHGRILELKSFENKVYHLVGITFQADNYMTISLIKKEIVKILTDEQKEKIWKMVKLYNYCIDYFESKKANIKVCMIEHISEITGIEG